MLFRLLDRKCSMENYQIWLLMNMDSDWSHLPENEVQRTLGFFKALNRGLHLIIRMLI